jgi:hypothetical protein
MASMGLFIMNHKYIIWHVHVPKHYYITNLFQSSQLGTLKVFSYKADNVCLSVNTSLTFYTQKCINSQEIIMKPKWLRKKAMCDFLITLGIRVGHSLVRNRN